MSSNRSTVGFIGLGDLGAPMARRLLRVGHKLHIWARNPATIVLFDEQQAIAASDLSALGMASDMLCLCVGYDADILALLLDQGLLRAMRPGSIVAIHSTVHPDTIMQVVEAAAKRNIGVVDAPISGGRTGAANGTLSIMVGSERQIFEKALPVLQDLGRPFLLGGPGAGQLAKLLNNTLMSANIAMAADALITARQLKLDPVMFEEILGLSSGQSVALAILSQRLADIRAGEVPKRPDILAKDVSHFASIRPDSPAGIALEAAGQRGVEALAATMTP